MIALIPPETRAAYVENVMTVTQPLLDWLISDNATDKGMLEDDDIPEWMHTNGAEVIKPRAKLIYTH